MERGTTTQLLIYPSGTSIGGQNFEYRISTAIVKDEFSNFTQMPGYERQIMLLTNKIALTHVVDGVTQKPVGLEPFHRHIFSGDDITTCKGSCQDFNFIYRKNVKGDIYPIYGGTKYILDGRYKYLYYSLVHAIAITLSGEDMVLQVGDVLHVKDESLQITFSAMGHNDPENPLMVCCEIM